jgi:hypothetical protein
VLGDPGDEGSLRCLLRWAKQELWKTSHCGTHRLPIDEEQEEAESARPVSRD